MDDTTASRLKALLAKRRPRTLQGLADQLGVTRQRVHQLVKEIEARKGPTRVPVNRRRACTKCHGRIRTDSLTGLCATCWNLAGQPQGRTKKAPTPLTGNTTTH